MTIPFAILAALTFVAALAAMFLRNLVHCALAFAAALGGLAAIYLQLGAEFIGWAQVLVYIGAVAILVVFAILLTRRAGAEEPAGLSPTWLTGGAVALLVFGVLAFAVTRSSALPPASSTPAAAIAEAAKVKRIGAALMTDYVLPLEVIGLLLTAALIGAVVIAMPGKEGER